MDRLLKAARTSGSLNLSNRSLRDVPNEVYQSLDAVGKDENWWEAVELQKLILAHNNIESLKEDLRNLPQLTVLNVSHNKLSDLPAAIGELPMLKSLDVSFNSILKIPEEIGSATSLVKFDCSCNRLKELPSSIGQCVELSDLKASKNVIVGLPEDLVNCSKLTKLDVEGNKLTMLSENLIASWTMLTEFNASKNLLSSIPENIGNLSHLIRFDLHQNKISSIPPSIMGCSSLVEFYMGNNSLSSLPTEIGVLSRLGNLDLHSNQLKEYPVEACKLHLSVLDLLNNSLTGLPPEMGNMTTLRKLLLTGNPLRTLRSSLVSGPTPALLKYLRSRLSEGEDSEITTPTKEDVITRAARLSITSKELSLEGLSLSAVPSEVWESGEIIKVDLSRNAIQELPVELSSCISLQTLILSRNKIKDWPGAILKSLPNLLCLKLDNNPLRQIPSDGFQAVSRIQVLDLSGNASSLPEHPAFSSMSHLQELYLRRMQLHEVPSDIFNLQQLRILDLSQNSLQSISVEFQRLISLSELGLSDNNISVLPPELGLLEPSLQALRLDGNPMRSIRRTILDRGTKAVLNYLKDKIPQ
ncbi:plant intracellular Ras-group-related LRR protein 6 [Quercus lobata]|uniref:plant intracellular Ras-group-related LRR protein 6 n=1 Tax=Quercus lobata TaxID=97700 RepID=UPI001243F89D|nr:plant intracellular Ras-group-related LRR protein 6 [Quercus lobata]